MSSLDCKADVLGGPARGVLGPLTPHTHQAIITRANVGRVFSKWWPGSQFFWVHVSPSTLPAM